MLVLSFVLLLLATAVFASPSRRGSVPASALLLPSGQQRLIAPTDAPSFVVVGVGFQNYTCMRTGTWTASGAIAQLFDITGLYHTPEFSRIQQDAHGDWVNFQTKDALDPVMAQKLEDKYNITLSGQHYYVYSGEDLNPVWDFTSNGPTAGNPDAIVVADGKLKSIGDIPAPSGFPDIDWQQVWSVSGKLASTIFRVDTVGGQRAVNDSCQEGEKDSAKFTAVFWLYGSEL